MALLRCILQFAGHMDRTLSFRFVTQIAFVLFLFFPFWLGFGEELGSSAQTEEVDPVEV